MTQTAAIADRPGARANGQGGDGISSINLSEAERLASMLGGGALTLYGLSRRSLGGLGLALLGGDLVYRGMTGRCGVYAAMGISTAVPGHRGIKVQEAVTINRSPEELYRFWRDFENLPRFMEHLISVTTLSDQRSHWVAKAPAGKTVEWDAEIIAEQPNELIAWRSLEGADIPNAGSVRFQRAPGGRGTEVRVSLEYNPPAGLIGEAVARLFGEEPEQQIEADLRHLKQLMEAGEIPTTQGQPLGARARSPRSQEGAG